MIRGILAIAFGMAAMSLSAQTLWLYGAALKPSGDAAELTFSVRIESPGYYEAALQVQGEQAQEYSVVMELAEERTGKSVTTRFSFAGLGCG